MTKIAKSIFLILILFLFNNENLKSQVKDSIEIKDILNLSIEDLLKIKVAVSSSQNLNISETPSTVTLIDQEMISKYNFNSLVEAIDIVAGIDIKQTIIDKNIPTSRGILQNFYANKVLILIDNVPTWQPIYGNGYLDRINIQDIDRIEILKGPASVLHGSNAFTAVINIVLKKINQSEIIATLITGTPNYKASGINIRYAKNDFKLMTSINTSLNESNAFKLNAARGFNYNGDSIFYYKEKEESSNINFKINYKSSTLYYNTFYFGHSFMGAHPSYVGGGGNLVKNYGHFINYNFNKDFKKSHISANVGYDYFQRNFPLSADRVSLIWMSGDRMYTDFLLNYKLSKNMNFEIGLEGGDSKSYGHDTRNALVDTLIRHNLSENVLIYQWSAFSQLNFNYKMLTILGGIRLTQNKFFGTNISSRVTTMFKISNRSSIKYIYGESFRSPTMFELFFNHPTVIGNTSLKPETSKSNELVYFASFKNFYFQIIGYYGIYNNLIQRVTPETGPPSIYQNANSFEGYGSEMELKFQNSKILNFFINYNYISGIKSQNDNNFKFVPDHTISMGVNKVYNNFSISSNIKYYSAVSGHLEKIEPQFNANINLQFKQKLASYNLIHTWSIRNMFDSKMLTPEYIRQTPNINSIPTDGYGRMFLYTLTLNI